MTIQSLKHTLSDLGYISIDGPYMLELLNIGHLYSIISIKIKANNLTDILRKLLMKGAYPPEEGINMLSTLEDFDRGPYYGNHFVIYPDGRCESSQILRCIFKSSGETYSIAGASISAFSDTENEVSEIHGKLKSIFFYY